jgi:hypothetical protein
MNRVFAAFEGQFSATFDVHVQHRFWPNRGKAASSVAGLHKDRKSGNFHSHLWNILIDRTSANKSYQALTTKKDTRCNSMNLLGIFDPPSKSTR